MTGDLTVFSDGQLYIGHSALGSLASVTVTKDPLSTMPQKRVNNTTFTFCDTPQSLSAVAANIRGSSTVFLDCEGHDLGLAGGGLSLISLGAPTPNQPQTYLIDAVALGTSELRPIFDILESPNVQKVVFDGRMNQTALFYDHGGVRLQNVVDLQLADIKSRVLRGENEGSLEQLMRLSPYLLQSEVEKNPQLYYKVQKASGAGADFYSHHSTGRFKHTSWLRRPLPQTALVYAANDITLIAHLWEEFVDQGYIDGKLGVQSLRYVRLWTTGPQINVNHRYKLHALLPLEILEDTTAVERTKLCPLCERLLPQRCFSITSWNRDVNRTCLVCRAIGIRIIKQK
ncbi:ribonuclease H-like domain-containing protein, partial [Mycena metata]